MGKKKARFKFGQAVKRLRKKRGWTQKKLAKRAKISRSYLQIIEGQNPPNVSIDKIFKIIRTLDITPPEIFK